MIKNISLGKNFSTSIFAVKTFWNIRLIYFDSAERIYDCNQGNNDSCYSANWCTSQFRSCSCITSVCGRWPNAIGPPQQPRCLLATLLHAAKSTNIIIITRNDEAKR